MKDVVTLTAARSGLSSKMRLRLAMLRVVEGPDRGAEVEISADPVLLGSHPSCNLVLTDQTVSSRHAEIVLRPAGYLLRDLGSKNGVFVNNLRAEQVYLAPGARIRIGKTCLEVVDSGRTAEFDLSGASRFGRLLGGSLPMRRLFATLESVAKTDLTVLLEGETGTGKGLVAEEIHRGSSRAEGPLETFDCGSVQPNLIESELFGHEKGAFTGAVSTHIGAVERADGGTLFLDEIGDLPADLQPKLLRMLESRQFTRVGGTKAQTVALRFIAATNRRLEQEVATGQFRQDLYYRIAVLRVTVPPLRERLDDLPLLVDHFFRDTLPEGESPVDRFGGLVPLMATYDWPGNVRELRNVVERLTLLSPEEALPTPIRPGGALADLRAYHEARERAIDQFERVYVRDLLRQTAGNVTRAAELAQVSRRYVTRLMTKHQIDRKETSREED
jgi:DNA-binding NtrC family response regulator